MRFITLFVAAIWVIFLIYVGLGIYQFYLKALAI